MHVKHLLGMHQYWGQIRKKNSPQRLKDSLLLHWGRQCCQCRRYVSTVARSPISLHDCISGNLCQINSLPRGTRLPGTITLWPNYHGCCTSDDLSGYLEDGARLRIGEDELFVQANASPDRFPFPSSRFIPFDRPWIPLDAVSCSLLSRSLIGPECGHVLLFAGGSAHCSSIQIALSRFR